MQKEVVENVDKTLAKKIKTKVKKVSAKIKKTVDKVLTEKVKA